VREYRVRYRFIQAGALIVIYCTVARSVLVAVGALGAPETAWATA
jgi:hypothetical protein